MHDRWHDVGQVLLQDILQPQVPEETAYREADLGLRCAARWSSEKAMTRGENVGRRHLGEGAARTLAPVPGEIVSCGGNSLLSRLHDDTTRLAEMLVEAGEDVEERIYVARTAGEKAKLREVLAHEPELVAVERRRDSSLNHEPSNQGVVEVWCFASKRPREDAKLVRASEHPPDVLGGVASLLERLRDLLERRRYGSRAQTFDERFRGKMLFQSSDAPVPSRRDAPSARGERSNPEYVLPLFPAPAANPIARVRIVGEPPTKLVGWNVDPLRLTFCVLARHFHPSRGETRFLSFELLAEIQEEACVLQDALLRHPIGALYIFPVATLSLKCWGTPRFETGIEDGRGVPNGIVADAKKLLALRAQLEAEEERLAKERLELARRYQEGDAERVPVPAEEFASWFERERR